MNRAVTRIFYATYGSLLRTHALLNSVHALARAGFAGLWLGVLTRDALLEIGNGFYSSTPQYTGDEYNQRGLWSWEQRALARYFRDCRRVLVVGAGGGREVLALARRGYEVHGVECNPDLVRAGNLLLERQGLPPRIEYAPPDTAPAEGAAYDGLIIGWGAYMLIQGRPRRVALLQSVRAHVNPGAPLLASFFVRSPAARRFRVTTAVGNTLRRVLGREPLELGDALEPEYVHYFTREEIAAELQQGGFALEHYSEDQYGHVVATAVGASHLARVETAPLSEDTDQRAPLLELTR